MKHEVGLLEGALLDAAVALAEEIEPCTPECGEDCEFWEYSPSTNWKHGGPIIERERIGLDAGDSVTDWTAYAPMAVKLGIASQDGPTALIAAMRAFVASRFGGEVEL